MTAKIKVYGNQKINGSVEISGAKNAALPLIAASILSTNGLSIHNVPPLTDISTMLSLLEELGLSHQLISKANYSKSLHIKSDSVDNYIAPYEIVKKMRASILVLGPLLSRFGFCKVSLPGGCAIGVRPVDLHLKVMEVLGAKIELIDGYISATAPSGLRGAEFEFPIVTVTGTENAIMAAVLAEGTTVLKNSASEPEVINLIDCLNKMGASIKIEGTNTLIIKGVSNLYYTEHNVISDRIEAGTYAVAAGITGGKIDLFGESLRANLNCFINKMTEIGMIFSDIDGGIRCESSGRINAVNLETAPYPLFPTDLQAQTMSLLSIANGKSVIHETIWENRFMHVAELARMGADINISNAYAHINGVKKLKGAQVMATDLRASFSMILAGLIADGETIIDRVYHLDRGYCCVNDKLKSCGVEIERL